MMPGVRDTEIICAAIRSARHPEDGFINTDEEESVNRALDGVANTLARQFGQQRHDFDKIKFLHLTETRR